MEHAMVQIKRILCPTDFSELAHAAIAYACSLAEAFGSELHVLHVVDESYQYWVAMGPNSLPMGPRPEEILVTAKEQMERCKREQFSTVARPVVAEVVVGRPFLEIIRYAREKKIDLIVM